MTDIEQLAALYYFITDYCSVQIRQNKKRKDTPNGVFDGVDDSIVIYCRDRTEEAGLVSAILIHEYGHYICKSEIGHYHFNRNNNDLYLEEKRAWTRGRASVSRCMVPRHYMKMKKVCLDGYKRKQERECSYENY